MGFEHIFGSPPESVARAPGRVNLIGEHTDYNGGFVLPAVIPQKTTVALRRRNGFNVRAFSANMDTGSPWDEVVNYTVGKEERRGSWIDYVQGATAVLGRKGFAPSGFDVFIESDVPPGSGLSSSAALEVSLLRALRQVFLYALSDMEIARIAREVENEFVGAPVGIMDPLVCSLGIDHHALFVDTRSMDTELIPIPGQIELVVIDSGIAHFHAAGDYKTRRAECMRAASLLGVAELRDAALEQAEAAGLPEPLGRRVRHVVTENARVLMAVDALKAGDAKRLGELFHASHASMRDDYEVSIPEIDRMVAIASADTSIWGARLTGGGFGGSVVMLAREGEGAAAAARIAEAYASQTNASPTVLVPQGIA